MFRLRAEVLPNLLLQILIAIIATDAWVSNSADPGRVQLLFFASLLTCGWYAVRHVPFPSFFHWFVLSYIALFYVYPIVTPLLGMDLGAAREIVGGYVFLSIVGLHLFIVAYEATRKGRSFVSLEQPRLAVKLPTLSRTMWLLVFVNALGVLLIIVDAGGLSVNSVMGMLEIGRVERKLQSGPLSLLGNYLILAGAPAYAIGPLYLQRRKRWIIPFIALWLVSDAIVFVAFRARTALIMHLFALLIGYFYLRRQVEVDVPGDHARRRGRHARRRTRRWSIAVAMALIVVIGTVLRSQRGRIGSDFGEGILTGGVSSTLRLTIAYESRVGADFGHTATVFRVLELVPGHHDHLHGQSYYRLLLAPIPRFLWLDKPVNTGLIVGRWLFPGTTVQSNPPGVMGDLYLNFGYFGVLGFFLYGVAFGTLDGRRRLKYDLLVAVSFGSVVHFARGEFTNPILHMVVLYLVASAIEQAWTARHPARLEAPFETPL